MSQMGQNRKSHSTPDRVRSTPRSGHDRSRRIGQRAFILRLHRGGTGILKIGKTLGIGTGTVQRVLMEQPRPFDVGVAEAAL